MATEKLKIPEGLLSDSGWRGALTILSCDLLTHKGVWRFVDLEKGSIRFDTMIRAAGPWSSGERILVKVAASLFNPRFKCPPLWEIVGTLDSGNLRLVVEAIRYSAGLSHDRDVAALDAAQKAATRLHGLFDAIANAFLDSLPNEDPAGSFKGSNELLSPELRNRLALIKDLRKKADVAYLSTIGPELRHGD